MLEENIGIVYKKGEQHKDFMKARFNSDHSHRVTICKMLKHSSLFVDTPVFPNTINRTTTVKKINADEWIEIGQEIIDIMTVHKFLRKN